MANPLANFLSDELAAAAQHLATLKVNALKELKNGLSLEDDIVQVRDVFQEMAVIWGDLKPLESIVRSLFPQLNPLFDLLDKLASLDQEFLKAIE